MLGVLRPQKPLWPFTLNVDCEQAVGLVGWWPGGPSGGLKLFDRSGKGNHGTLTGFASPFTTASGWVAGLGPGADALICDGSSDVVDFGNVDFIAGDFSLGYWVKKLTGSTSFTNIWGLGRWNTGGTPGTNEYELALTDDATGNTNKPTLYYEVGTTKYLVTAATALTLGRWAHVFGTRSGGTITVYINGNPDATSSGNSASAITNRSRNLKLAGADVGILYANAVFFDPRLYNRALSAAEVAAIYHPATRWQLRYQPGRTKWFLGSAADVSAAITGTATVSITEVDIVAGGKTIIITLTGDTWIAAGALSFDLVRQAIIDGMTSAQSELLGWNNVVKALQSVTGVVRTSDTAVTVTLDAEPTYDITALETITVTVPSSALTGAGGAVIASPTFSVSPVGGATVQPPGVIGGGYSMLAGYYGG